MPYQYGTFQTAASAARAAQRVGKRGLIPPRNIIKCHGLHTPKSLAKPLPMHAQGVRAHQSIVSPSEDVPVCLLCEPRPGALLLSPRAKKPELLAVVVAGESVVTPTDGSERSAFVRTYGHAGAHVARASPTGEEDRPMLTCRRIRLSEFRALVLYLCCIRYAQLNR